MGKFPVISVSLKSVFGDSYEAALAQMSKEVGKEALRFHFLLDSEHLTEEEKGMYRKLVLVDAEHPGYFNMPEDVVKGA